MSTTLQPLSQSHRDENLDILRGFALAGVLFVYCTIDMGVSETHMNTVFDLAVQSFGEIMIEERMYSMLILVFGFGFGVQIRKAVQKNQSLVVTFVRRLSGLLLIGILHAILLSNRDVLISYAIAGFALLPARNFSNRQLLIYLVLILLISLKLPLILRSLGLKPVLTLWVPPNDLSSYWKFTWQFFKEYHQTYAIYFDMLIYFLLGFYFERIGLLKKLEVDSLLRKKTLIWFFILAALFGFLFLGPYLTGKGTNSIYGFINSVKPSWLKSILWDTTSLLSHLERFSFVAFYAVALISINSLKTGKTILQPLVYFGQMALSNYLIQSILIVPYALWFNKYNNMAPFSGFILFLIILIFQVFFGTWWLKRYNFGPFEWLLRSFTYWKWQPMKKKEIIQTTEMAL